MTALPGSGTTAVERAQAFERMERENGLFDYRFDGWSPWRVMRNALHRKNLALPIARASRSNTGRALTALTQTLRFCWLLATVDRRRLLVKTSRSGLRRQVGDRYLDVYFDGLLAREKSHFKIEENNSSDFARQARHALYPGALDPVFFTFWGMVFGRFFPVRAMPFCEKVSALLLSECGIRVAPEWLRLRISTVHWQARLYGMLLRRLNPSAVMVSDTGEYGLRLASLRAGIRFVELQHGVFNVDHPDAIPEWVSGTTGELLLPDRLACRGSYWIEQLAGTRQGRDVAEAVGNEVIDGARQRRRSAADGVVRLVVSSQGLDSENLASWLSDMVAAAPVGLDWQLDLKLHPTYDVGTSAFAQLAKHPGIRIIGGAETPNVFDLLAEADLHLSIASACHFDAAALDVPSIVIPLSGHEAMLPAAREGILLLAESPETVWQVADNLDNFHVDATRFSLPGFLDNIAKLIPD